MLVLGFPTDTERGLVFTAGNRDEVWEIDLTEPDTQKIVELGNSAKVKPERAVSQFRDISSISRILQRPFCVCTPTVPLKYSE